MMKYLQIVILLFSVLLGDIKLDSSDNVSRFLQKIKMMESSNGLNTDHPEMESGIHQGQSAIGNYGLMPNTIQEMVNRAKLGHTIDPNLQSIDHQPDDIVRQILTDKPDIQDELAQILAKKVLERSGGDEERAAYRWNMGHNLPPSRINQENLDSNDYIRKFRNLKSIVGR